MMNLKYIYLIFLSTIIISCKLDRNREKDKISILFNQERDFSKSLSEGINIPFHDKRTQIINVDEFNLDLTLKDIIDTFWFIPLETKKECVVGNIDKSILIDSLTFLMDGRNSKAIYIFNNDGKFLNKIDNDGKGPNEYVSLDNFSIDREKKLVVIPDLSRARVLMYDFNGKFISTERCKFRFNELAIIKKSILYHLGNTPNQNIVSELMDKELVALDSLRECTYFLQEKYPNKLNYGISNQLVEYDGKVLFAPPIFSNTIYELNDSIAYPKYYIDFHDKKIPEGKLLDLNRDNYSIFLKENNYCVFSGFNYETNDYLMIRFSYKNGVYYSFFNKNKNVSETYRLSILFDPNYLSFFPQVIGTIPSQNIFIGLVQPYHLINQSKEFRGKYQINNLTEIDNPILCYFKLKN